jgi:arylsulfatase
LAALLFIAAGCGRSPGPESGSGRKPDIILITVDALRADHLGLYGYDRPTSPHLDAFSREAVVVRDHIAQAPYTKASIASLFTGLFPTAHKAFTTSRSFSDTMSGHVAGELPVTDVLDPRLETLAERLASAGYQTHGLNTNPFLLAEFGFAQGFERYEFLVTGENFSNAPDVIARAFEVLDARDRSRPLFLWFHLMEPHSPYTPAARLRHVFPPRTPPLLAPPETIPAWIVSEGSLDARVYEALYDADIREADDAIGAFLSGLKARGMWEASVVVVTSDHGEEFFDHGGFEHNRTLYDEMLRVPLIVKAPGLPPGIREAQTQSVDLLPTLAAAAGLTIADLHGTDIWRVLRGTGEGERYAVSELVGNRYALRTREWKLISTLAGLHELYDLRQDPHEQRNVVGSELDRTVQFRDVLTRILASSAMMGQKLQGQFAPIQPRVLERLKALGYVR